MAETLNKTGDTHSFSRSVAKKYGVNAALVFGYISKKIHASKNMVGGKQWYYATVKDIAKQYPYLKPTTVYNALCGLTGGDGLLVTGCYNKKGYDRTVWYAFRTGEAGRIADRRPIYFGVEEAIRYDVAKAVLLSNLRYWIGENRKECPNYQLHPMSPTQLADLLPYSKATIQRKLNELVNVDGELVSVAALDSRDPAKYGFVGEVWLEVQFGMTGAESVEKPIKPLNDRLNPEYAISEPQTTILGDSEHESCSLKTE
jgi:hypothetical protein